MWWKRCGRHGDHHTHVPNCTAPTSPRPPTLLLCFSSMSIYIPGGCSARLCTEHRAPDRPTLFTDGHAWTFEERQEGGSRKFRKIRAPKKPRRQAAEAMRDALTCWAHNETCLACACQPGKSSRRRGNCLWAVRGQAPALCALHPPCRIYEVHLSYSGTIWLRASPNNFSPSSLT